MAKRDLTTIQSHERDVWAAVYAAEWVASFRAAMALGVPFDRATGADGKPDTLDHAERAIAVANRAVLQLRGWREREDPHAGERIDLEREGWIEQ